MEQIYYLTFGFDSLQVNKPCFSAKNQCKSLNQRPLQKCDLVVLGMSLFCPPPTQAAFAVMASIASTCRTPQIHTRFFANVPRTLSNV
jgi:hypothetical protein